MNELGNIKIADDVVKTISAKAAQDVSGVYKLAGGVADEVSKMLGKKRLTNGVKVEVGEKECSVEVYIIVEYGYQISEVAQNVQKNVLAAISTMTGLKVVEVNVFVQDVKILSDSDQDERHEDIEIV
ncbi:Asp23/Gls24 family envelope stress response protein [uncultured Cetobacterium sp.]|uniref:Asp23/Gls24 family envelope stress response protein n=1 Tax=uncultured Cetobacterium sp. TaxID=527638 RepID=UPI002627E36A|nr:Asp23/Gls24 family envelope stress response protein [uncultured Cetobacterium sp.]